MIQLKKSHEIYTYGQLIIDAENENVFAYTRQLEGKTVVVAGNLTDKQSSLTLPFDIERMQSNYITTIVN